MNEKAAMLSSIKIKFKNQIPYLIVQLQFLVVNTSRLLKWPKRVEWIKITRWLKKGLLKSLDLAGLGPIVEEKDLGWYLAESQNRSWLCAIRSRYWEQYWCVGALPKGINPMNNRFRQFQHTGAIGVLCSTGYSSPLSNPNQTTCPITQIINS